MGDINMTQFAQPYSGSNADMEDFIVPRRTTVQLEAVGNLINTEDKFRGKMCFNTTLGVPVWAASDAAASAWVPGPPALIAGPGAGILVGAGTIAKTSVVRAGGIITTEILLDLTGLDSATSDGDIIGDAALGLASLAGITASENGTILGGFMECLETPAGASITLDIDLFVASVNTGVHEVAMSGLAGQAVVLTKGGNWAAGDRTVITGAIDAADFLYLANGAADTAATYTAGQFLIQLKGYDA